MDWKRHMYWKRRPESIVMASIEDEIMGELRVEEEEKLGVGKTREWCEGISMACNNARKHYIF